MQTDLQAPSKAPRKVSERFYNIMAGFILVVIFINAVGCLAALFTGQVMENIEYFIFAFINLIAWFFALEIQ